VFLNVSTQRSQFGAIQLLGRRISADLSQLHRWVTRGDIHHSQCGGVLSPEQNHYGNQFVLQISGRPKTDNSATLQDHGQLSPAREFKRFHLCANLIGQSQHQLRGSAIDIVGYGSRL
jgi:hypothetical protein